jgi:hypothetical protein
LVTPESEMKQKVDLKKYTELVESDNFALGLSVTLNSDFAITYRSVRLDLLVKEVEGGNECYQYWTLFENVDISSGHIPELAALFSKALNHLLRDYSFEVSSFNLENGQFYLRGFDERRALAEHKASELKQILDKGTDAA